MNYNFKTGKCDCGCAKNFLKNIKNTCHPQKQKVTTRKEKECFDKCSTNNKLYKYKIKNIKR